MLKTPEIHTCSLSQYPNQTNNYVNFRYLVLHDIYIYIDFENLMYIWIFRLLHNLNWYPKPNETHNNRKSN